MGAAGGEHGFALSPSRGDRVYSRAVREPTLDSIAPDAPARRTSDTLARGPRGRARSGRLVRALVAGALVAGAAPACFVEPRSDEDILGVPLVSDVDCWYDFQCDDGNPCTQDTCVRKEQHSGACRFVHTADTPDDRNPCTVDSCVDGVALHVPAAQGTPCGEGGALTCDGDGACTGCSGAPGACGQWTECLSWGCEADTCVLLPAVAGLVLEAQVEGDCATVVCDGEGSTRAVYDGEDSMFIEGDPCRRRVCGTEDGIAASPAGTPCGDGCFRIGSGFATAQGVCSTNAACVPTADLVVCAEGYGCEAGQCKTSCADDADCHAANCKDGACVPP